MAAPFLQSVDHFCKNTYEYQHDINKPTKHNSLCNYKSTWDVIKENIDFENVEQMNTTLQPPETNFEIMYPYENGKFVLAIDTSSNMNYKMDSLQVNLCQKLLFLHQLAHNMTTDCSLNYKFNT